MIRHIVFFSAKDPKDIPTIIAGLSLLKDSPHALRLEVSLNTRDDAISQQKPDVVVYAEFESDEQLNLYKQHPLYQRAIDIVRPLRDMRIAADIDAETLPNGSDHGN